MDPAKFFNLYEQYAAKYSDALLQDMFGFAEEAEFKRLVTQTTNAIAAIRDTVTASPVMCSDETSARVSGKTDGHWPVRSARDACDGGSSPGEPRTTSCTHCCRGTSAARYAATASSRRAVALSLSRSPSLASAALLIFQRPPGKETWLHIARGCAMN
jgi:hypothetical protein